MSQAATLPTGWAKILDDIRRHIDDAIAVTDARLAKTLVVDEESPVGSRQQTLIDLGSRLQGITERLRSAEQVIEATDTRCKRRRLADAAASDRVQNAIAKAD